MIAQSRERKAGRKRKALRRLLFKLIAWAAISLALLVSLLKLALPWIAQHPNWIAAQLSYALDAKVTLKSAQSNFKSQLQLELTELEIGSALRLNRAYAKLDPLGFLPGRPWVKELRLEALELSALQTAQGWRLSGFGTAPSNPDFDWRQMLSRVGQVSIARSALELQTQDGRQHRFANVAIALRREDGLLKVGAHLQPNAPLSNAIRRTALSVPNAEAENLAKASVVLHWPDRASDPRPVDLYLDLDNIPLQRVVEWLPERAVLTDSSGLLDAQLWLTLRPQADAGGESGWHINTAQFQANAKPTAPRDGVQIFPTRSLSVLGDTRDGVNWQGELRLAARAPSPARLAQANALESRAPWALKWPQQGKRRAFELQSLDLAALSEGLIGLAQLEHAKALNSLRPAGKLDARFWLDPAQAQKGQSWQTSLKATGLKTGPVDRFPGVENLDLALQGDLNALSFQASGENLRYLEPRRFKGALRTQQLKASGAFWRSGPDGWQLDVPEIVAIDPDFAARAALQVQAVEGRTALPDDDPVRAPQIEFRIDVSRGNIARASDFGIARGWRQSC
ncbi:hypothetical protein HC761_01470 [bacterium]|nr:hypothetical protein [bacterium]